jgi:hypothetical protein
VCAIIAALIYQSVIAKNRLAGIMLSTFLMGVLVHNTYENVLFTNFFPITAICWLNMGFYVAACKTPSTETRRSVRRVEAKIRPEDMVFKRPW